jgi:hypothetical protein
MKYESGIANGNPPLGFKSEKTDNGMRERKVLDMNGIGGNPKIGSIYTLLALLKGYVSGKYSYLKLADHLNAQGYRTRLGTLFTKGSVEQVLENKFYEGKIVYHPGKSDEEVRDGKQEVPEEIKELWKQCQEVKFRRNKQPDGRPRLPRRAYPFSKVALCDVCNRNYVGQPSHRKSGRVIRGDYIINSRSVSLHLIL